MTNWKAALSLTLILACAAVILWSIDTYKEPDYQCGTKSLERANKTKEVFEKYKRSLFNFNRFNRSPDRVYVKQAFLREEKTGKRTKEWGIVIILNKELDQYSLPPEQRIPDELEGVPVQILTRHIWHLVEPFQWEGSGSGHFHYMADVISKNRDLFREYSFSDGARIGFPKNRTEVDNERIWGIDLWVTEKVHNLGLSPTRRIPDCLEDVPVTITVKPKFATSGILRPTSFYSTANRPKGMHWQ